MYFLKETFVYKFTLDITMHGSKQKHGGRLMCSLQKNKAFDNMNFDKINMQKDRLHGSAPISQQKVVEKSRRREHILHFLE